MFDRDAINIWKNYRLINEVSEQYIEEIQDAIQNKELPFNNIFGDKLRIWIPVSGTETYNEILNVIKNIPNYDSFDPEKKEIIKKIKLDPKYGAGIKEQRINLGKAISSLKLSDSLKKKYLDWYATYNTNIPELENLKKYAIIISRSPIDVLRMSDVGSIQSCHSEGGSYFKCAIQEAKSGGLIAFLVKKQDLDTLNEDEFQNEEIFEDKKRRVSGITALSRLRIRRYTNKNTKLDLAIPEVRLYGNRLSGFYDSIKTFLLQKQEDLNIDTVYKDYEKDSIVRRGGTYTDSSDSELFNRMFDTDTFRGSVEHEPEDISGEEYDREQQFEEELQDFHRRWTRDLKHFSIGYDIEVDDEIYYYAHASIGIELPDDFELTDDFIDELDYSTLIQIKDYKEGVKYRDRIPYGFKNDEKFKKIKKFIDYLKGINSFFDDDFSSIYLGHNGNIILGVCFGDDCSGSSFNTDDYLDFCRNVSNLDDKGETIKRDFIKALKICGYIKNITVQEEDPDEFNNKLQNFSYTQDEDFQFELSSRRILNLNLQNLTGLSKFVNKKDYIEKLNNFVISSNPENKKDFKQKIEIFLTNYLNQHYTPKINDDEKQLTFKQFVESVNKKSLIDYGIIDIETSLSQQSPHLYETIGIDTILQIKIDLLTKETSNVLLFLDKHIDDITNVMSLLVRILYHIDDTYTKNLRKIYSKYLIHF